MRRQTCQRFPCLSTTQQRTWTEAELRELGHMDAGEFFFTAARNTERGFRSPSFAKILLFSIRPTIWAFP